MQHATQFTTIFGRRDIAALKVGSDLVMRCALKVQVLPYAGIAAQSIDSSQSSNAPGPNAEGVFYFSLSPYNSFRMTLFLIYLSYLPSSPPY